MSFPSRERGLKLYNTVAIGGFVASFPSRERGLKRYCLRTLWINVSVVPLAGTWIETGFPPGTSWGSMRRSPRGNVD